MKRIRRHSRNLFLKITALILFAAIVITDTTSLFAEGNSIENTSEAEPEEGQEDESSPAPTAEDEDTSDENTDQKPENADENGDQPPADAKDTDQDSINAGGTQETTPPEDQSEGQDEAALASPTEPADPTETTATDGAVPTNTPGTGETAGVPATVPEETATATPSAEPTITPDETPVVTPTAAPSVIPDALVTSGAAPSVSPSAEPSASPSAEPGVSPSAAPSVSPTAVPSATPSASPSATPISEASIHSSSSGISGTGLGELTVSFDTIDLGEEDTFNIILSTEAEDVSIVGNVFAEASNGCYKVNDLRTDALNITFKNLNGEDFILNAEGTEVTFTYAASEEVQETESGMAGNATIIAASEEEEIIELTNRNLVAHTADGGWVYVKGLLPEGATVTAVPVEVEIEGKEVLAAYDITIWDAEDKEYKITEAVTVSITAPAIRKTDAEEVSIYHMEDENAEAEKVADVEINSGMVVSFDAEGFSVYVVTAEGAYTDAEGSTKQAVNMNNSENMISAVVDTNFDPDTDYTRDSEFSFTLTYEFKNGHQPTTDNNVAYFTIPGELTGVMSSAKTINGTTYSRDGKAIGTYAISGNTITFTYNTDWLQDYTSNISGTFTFKAKISDSAAQGKDQVVLNFGGTGSEITINFDSGTVNGKKEHQISDDGTIEFTVTLNVTGKDAENVELTDTLGSNLKFASNGEFYLGDTRLTNVTIDGNVATIGIGNLAIGTYQLKYKAEIENSEITADTQNEIKWIWTANPEGESAIDYIWFQGRNISKSGTQENNRIKWIITVQPDAFSTVIGENIKDSLGTGHTYEGTYTIYRGDYWNNNVVKEGIIPEGTASFEYTFNETDITDPKKGEKYTIVYYTIPNEGIADGTVLTNYLNDESKEVTYTAEKMDIVTKSGKANNFDSDSEDSTITWTITIDPLKYAETADEITNLTLTDTWSAGSYVENSFSILDDEGYNLSGCIDFNVSDADKTLSVTFRNELEKAKKVIISYKTKGTPGESEQNAVHSTYSYGENKNEEDDLSNIEYTERATMPFDKTGAIDGNEVEWTIVANRTYYGQSNYDFKAGKCYYIYDTLPDGMQYVTGSAQYELMDKVNNETVTFDSGLIAPDENNGILTFSFEGDRLNSIRNGYVYIVIKFKTQIADDFSFDNVCIFRNNAQIYEDNVVFGEDSAEVTIENTILNKEGVVNKGDDLNRISYTISVNYAGEDLNKYSDELTLIDVLDVNTALDISSISVTDMNTGYPVDYDFSYDSTGEQGRFTLKIPDKRALKVTYEVSVAGIAGQTITITNKAELGGIENSESSEENQVKIVNSESTADGEAGSIIINKYDKSTNETLADATFTLYRYDNNEKIDEQTTGEDGVIIFKKDKDAEGKDTSLMSDRVYYYVETVAPEGYVLDETKHYFIIKGNDYQTALAELPAEIRAHVSRITGGNTFLIFNEAKPKVGALTVEKKFQGADALTDSEKAAISFTVTGPNDYNKTFTYGDMESGSLTIENLPLGTYTVTESNAEKAGYTLVTTYKVNGTASGTAEAAVEKNGTEIVELTNTYTQDAGSLTVTKNFAGDAALSDSEKEAVSFTVSGPNSYSRTFTYGDMESGSLTIENLPLGTYTITESNAEKTGYTLVTTYKVNGTASGTAEAAVEKNGTEIVELTNTYTQDAGSLTVTKNFAGDAALSDGEKEAVSFTVSGPNSYSRTFTYGDMESGSLTIENLPVGEYRVTESNAEKAGYTLVTTYKVNGTASGTAEAAVEKNGTEIVELTNTYTQDAGSLTVTKNFAGDAALSDSEKEAVSFTVSGPNSYSRTFTYADMESGSLTIENLPVGEYRVTESNAEKAGYTLVTTYKVNGTASGTAEAAVEKNGTEIVELTNTYTQDAGSLTVTKNFAGDAALSDSEKEAVSFTVSGPNSYKRTFTYGDMESGSLTIENLPLGTYTVTESNAEKAGYTLVTTYKVNGTASGTAEAAVEKNGTEIVELTNTYTQDAGSLTVTKNFAGDAALSDSEKEAISFTVSGPNSYSRTFTYGDMESGSLTIENLPLGTYTVTESNAEKAGYTLVTTYRVDSKDVSESIVEVEEGTNVEIELINTYTGPKETPTTTPTVTPDAAPTSTPTVTPGAAPTSTPTATPGAAPTSTPTATPSAAPTSTPTATPSAAPTSTPTASPSATPTGAPTAAPSSTPDSMPTPSSVPGATPEQTPEAGKTPTPEQTPEVVETPAPEATPGVTATPAASESPVPESTPEGTSETTPEITEVRTPDVVAPTAAPVVNRQVLGAKREKISASKGAVLGARRGLDCAVLGRRRRPGTGDSAAMLIWVLLAAFAVGGVLTSLIMLFHNKKNDK